jgi:hypothetical protein
VVKLDGSGDIQWEQALGGSGYDEGHCVRQADDGGYILTGSSGSNDGDATGNHGEGDEWVVKLDDNGDLQWQKSLGGTSDEIASNILQTADGGYIAAGTTLSNDGDVSGNQGGYDQWIVKLDGSGNIQWQKTLGGSGDDWASDLQQIADGGYVVAGTTESEDGDITDYHGGQYDAWVIRLNPGGTLLWQKTLGGSDFDSGSAIELTNDVGYIIAGSSSSTDGDVTGNHGGSDYWIVKLGPDDVGIAELENAVSFSLFPNPSTDAVSIQLDRAASATVRLQLYNSTGQLVRTPVDVQIPAGERTLRNPTGGLPTGTYELGLNAGGRTFTRKLVKL